MNRLDPSLKMVSMRSYGVTYDTGFLNAGKSTHEPFDSRIVKPEMQIIRHDLHCDAVRITGGNPDRLAIAAEQAAAAGLEVWFSPFTRDLTAEGLLCLLSDCAVRAERIRQSGAAVVLLTGSELSLFNSGFIHGDTLQDRLVLFTTPQRLREVLPGIPARINAFLSQAVSVVRERFHGKISYASLPFEGVDWSRFDFISTDAGYLSLDVAAAYRNGIRSLVALGKPVAVTEFGCTTYHGAADKGGHGDMILEWGTDGTPLRLNGDYTRDEDEQARCLLETLEILVAEGVDTAFVNTFARYDLPHRSLPREDFDLASYGIVKVLENRLGTTYPDMPWEPKAAFKAISNYYLGQRFFNNKSGNAL